MHFLKINSMNGKTPISTLGKVKFVEHIIESGSVNYDDAVVIPRGDKNELVSTCTMLEGIDFSLEYFPLKHLGFKSVTKAVSNIYAMNGTPKSITVALGISKRFAIEDVDEYYKGLYTACKYYGIELVGGNTSPSITGFMVSITCIGEVDAKSCVYRKGAKDNELICMTAGLGAAYMGLKILERERRALNGNDGVKPVLDGYEYVLSAYLQPFAAKETIEEFKKLDFVPTSMIDLTSGLSSGVLNLCHSNNLGARIFVEKLPIASEVSKVAEELNSDPLIATLNGGDDYELLFSVDAENFEKIKGHAEVIGYFTTLEQGAYLITPDNQKLTISSPDFTQQVEE